MADETARKTHHHLSDTVGRRLAHLLTEMAEQFQIPTDRHDPSAVAWMEAVLEALANMSMSLGIAHGVSAETFLSLLNRATRRYPHPSQSAMARVRMSTLGIHQHVLYVLSGLIGDEKTPAGQEEMAGRAFLAMVDLVAALARGMGYERDVFLRRLGDAFDQKAPGAASDPDDEPLVPSSDKPPPGALN